MCVYTVKSGSILTNAGYEDRVGHQRSLLQLCCFINLSSLLHKFWKKKNPSLNENPNKLQCQEADLWIHFYAIFICRSEALVLCVCLEYKRNSENTTPNCIQNISFLASLLVRLFYERKINQYVIIRVCSLVMTLQFVWCKQNLALWHYCVQSELKHVH